MIFVRFWGQFWEAFGEWFALESRSKISVVFGSVFFCDYGVRRQRDAGATRALTAQGPPRAAPLSRGKEDITTTWMLDPGSRDALHKI